MRAVVVTGSFDDLRSREVRFLEEAAKLGSLRVVLWPDEAALRLDGKAPKFPLEERLYLLRAIRYVDMVGVATGRIARDMIPELEEIWPGIQPEIWAVDEKRASAGKRLFCESRGLQYQVLREEALSGFRIAQTGDGENQTTRKKVVVTGCFDWFHTGHIRFFEEAAEYGQVYVVVGHDKNIKDLKGPGHPMFPQDERKYMVGAIRSVKQALISSGDGWLDAEPEIERIKPDRYIVNEDGDQDIKRQYCESHAIQYVVLKREPKPGLPPRTSTELRGS